MQLGHSWKQRKPDGAFDAIVIGSGIGGLAVAAVLARWGNKRVLVLERHYRVGGYTHSFARGGYDWDVGVHYVGQVGKGGAVRAILDRVSDGSVEWAPLPEVYDRIVLGPRSYDLVTGRSRFVERLAAYFPRDADAIARYVELVRATARQSSLHFASRALPRGLDVLARGVALRGFAALAARSTRDVLLELTRDEELIAVLTGQYGDYGLPPSQSSFAMHAALVSHYLSGAFYPVGGAERIARAFAPVIEARGGHLAVTAEVERVLVEGGRTVGVRLSCGDEVRAPLVVSDAGVHNTFGRLLPRELLPHRWQDALARATPSVSWYALYLGFKHTDEQLGLTGTNLWLYPDEKHDDNVRRYTEDPQAPFPVVYASFPSAKDPDFAQRHPGRATVDLVTMARWQWTERWQGTRWRHRGADYDAHKRHVTERLLEALYAQRPQLRGQVDVAELSTPLSAAHFGGFARGELYGIDHGPARYTSPLRPRTPVPGLFLAGADVATAGVAGALLGGIMAGGAILGLRVLGEVLRR
ncbi:MAG: FAD-dependent oxidoreductase [Deltaproteobacteria bacterium RBG_16_71_12]|nr:MAG: FAD-dependent oxidoreductase [Deltaproteobacteria bacterium RBG_16_71_12]